MLSQIREINRWNARNRFISRSLPCTLSLKWIHNHGLTTAEALSYQVPGADLKEQFIRYFVEGLNPSRAMKFHRDCLQTAPDFEEQHLADAGKNPSSRVVYRWHDEWRKQNLGMASCIMWCLCSSSSSTVGDITFWLSPWLSLNPG